MKDEFKTKINNDTQSNIKNVIDKLMQLRFDGNLKMYRNLTESLFRLITIFESTIKPETYTRNDSVKPSFRITLDTLDFLKNLILDLENEVESLYKKASIYLSKDDFYNHRDSIMSYEKIILIRNKMSPLYEFQLKLHN